MPAASSISFCAASRLQTPSDDLKMRGRVADYGLSSRATCSRMVILVLVSFVTLVSMAAHYDRQDRLEKRCILRSRFAS